MLYYNSSELLFPSRYSPIFQQWDSSTQWDTNTHTDVYTLASRSASMDLRGCWSIISKFKRVGVHSEYDYPGMNIVSMTLPVMRLLLNLITELTLFIIIDKVQSHK